MGALTAKFGQLGLLALLVLAAAGRVPTLNTGTEPAGLFSLPARSVQTTSESTGPQLFGGASRTKWLPKSDGLHALPAAPGVLIPPASSTSLLTGLRTGIGHSRHYAHSGRAPPSA